MSEAWTIETWPISLTSSGSTREEAIGQLEAQIAKAKRFTKGFMYWRVKPAAYREFEQLPLFEWSASCRLVVCLEELPGLELVNVQ